jgi:K+-sensing histidine kinase KdpD
MSRLMIEKYVIAYSILLGAIALVLDFLIGPFIRFPILFILPVILIGWYRGFRLALGFAVFLPLARLLILYYYYVNILTPWGMFENSVNFLIRIIVLSLLAYLVARTARQHKELTREVQILEGFLPICSFCKKIRDEEGNWQQLERYISNHSEAQFTHSFCPSCGKQHYGDYYIQSNLTREGKEVR